MVKYLHQKNKSTNWISLKEEDLDTFLWEIAPSIGETKTEAERFYSNVKFDIKSYPAFDGKLENWFKFKRSVLALAATHGLENIFDDNYVPPAENSGSDWDLYHAHNKCVYSIWSSRIYGANALIYVRLHEVEKDGRAIYQAFTQHYESTDNLQQATLLTLQALNNLSLTYQYSGGVPAFAAKFNDLLLDLRDAGKPLDGVLAKAMLINMIKDSNYTAIADNYANQASASELQQRWL